MRAMGFGMPLILRQVTHYKHPASPKIFPGIACMHACAAIFSMWRDRPCQCAPGREWWRGSWRRAAWSCRAAAAPSGCAPCRRCAPRSWPRGRPHAAHPLTARSSMPCPRSRVWPADQSRIGATSAAEGTLGQTQDCHIITIHGTLAITRPITIIPLPNVNALSAVKQTALFRSCKEVLIPQTPSPSAIKQHLPAAGNRDASGRPCRK